jgi:hypothetical protein
MRGLQLLDLFAADGLAKSKRQHQSAEGRQTGALKKKLCNAKLN